MAVTQVGTPATTSTFGTTTCTGVWNSTQPRTAGDLLVAVVFGADTTAKISALAESSGTWTKLITVDNTNTSPIGSTGQAVVGIFVIQAAGGDAAPSFTMTASGTGTKSCRAVLYELAGADTSNFAGSSFLDTSGTYGSGASSGTLSSISVTTSASVAASGEFAISAVAQERTATTVTWTDSSSFTAGLGGNGASNICGTWTGYLSGPTSGATLTDTGHFSTNSSAFGAGVIVVFQPPAAVQPTAAIAGAGTASAQPVVGASASVSGQGTAGATSAVMPQPYVIYEGAGNLSTTVPVGTKAGDAIVIIGDSSAVISSVSDSKGNTYVQQQSDTTDDNSLWVATYTGSAGTPTVALVAGTDTITVSPSQATLVILGVDGVAAQAPDANPAFIIQTALTPSGPSTGTLTASGDVVLYAICGGTSAATVNSWGAGLSGVASASAGGGGVSVGWQVTPSTTSVTPSATLGASQKVTTFTLALLQPVAAGVSAAAAVQGTGTATATPAIGASLAAQATATAGTIPGVVTPGTLADGTGTAGSGVIISVTALLVGTGSASSGSSASGGASASIGGVGTATATPAIRAPAAVPGAGTAGAVPAIGTGSALTGTGSGGSGAGIGVAGPLTGTGAAGEAPAIVALARLTAAGSALPVPVISVLAAISGLGSASATTQTGSTVSASIVGTGTASAVPTISVPAGLQGTGSASAVGAGTSGLLVGTGSATALPDIAVLALLQGTGSATASAFFVIQALASLVGTGTVGTVPVIGVTASVAGQGTAAATATVSSVTINATAAIAGTGTAGAVPTLAAKPAVLLAQGQAVARAQLAVLAQATAQGAVTATGGTHAQNIFATGSALVADPRDGRVTIGAAIAGSTVITDPRDGHALVGAAGAGSATVTKGGAA